MSSGSKRRSFKVIGETLGKEENVEMFVNDPRQELYVKTRGTRLSG